MVKIFFFKKCFFRTPSFKSAQISKLRFANFFFILIRSYTEMANSHPSILADFLNFLSI